MTIDRSNRITRIEFAKQLAMGLGLLMVGCSPLRILLKDYPKEFDTDSRLKDRRLRAFVTTIVPGAPTDEPNLVRIFSDEFYPFYKYCGFFVADISERSNELFAEDFQFLSLDERTLVVEIGLAADGTTARLYRGAILMAQISFFGGIYDDEKGCPLIDFHGKNSGFSTNEYCYRFPLAHLAVEATVDGNYS
jgi:hypothetical protein